MRASRTSQWLPRSRTRRQGRSRPPARRLGERRATARRARPAGAGRLTLFTQPLGYRSRSPMLMCALLALFFYAGVAAAQGAASADEAAADNSEAAAADEEERTADGLGAGELTEAPNDDPTARARMHFKMGVDFYREKNFAAALVEFKRAYEISPHYKLKFNLGQTAFELQDYSYAIDNLTAYLAEAGEEVPDDRRQVVEKMIDSLHSRLAFVTIESNEDDAQVYVDDRLIGATPFEKPVPIGAGRRRIVAIKQGFVTVEQRVDLAARDEATLSLEFEPPPEGETVVVTKVVEEDTHPAVYVGIGAAVAAAGAVTLAVLTAVTKQQYEDELKQETTAARLEELRDRVKSRALMTDIAIGVTGAAVVATVSTLLFDNDDEEERQQPELMPGMSLDTAQASLWLRGKF